jgi:predicted nucleic acid-binding protein
MRLGVNARGVLFLLLFATKSSILTGKDAVAAMRRMLDEGMWISPSVIDLFYRALEE